MTDLEVIEACRQAFMIGDSLSLNVLADHVESKGQTDLAKDLRTGKTPDVGQGRVLVWTVKAVYEGGESDTYQISVDVKKFCEACVCRAQGRGKSNLLFGSVKVRAQ